MYISCVWTSERAIKGMGIYRPITRQVWELCTRFQHGWINELTRPPKVMYLNCISRLFSIHLTASYYGQYNRLLWLINHKFNDLNQTTCGFLFLLLFNANMECNSILIWRQRIPRWSVQLIRWFKFSSVVLILRPLINSFSYYFCYLLYHVSFLLSVWKTLKLP